MSSRQVVSLNALGRFLHVPSLTLHSASLSVRLLPQFWKQITSCGIKLREDLA